MTQPFLAAPEAKRGLHVKSPFGGKGSLRLWQPPTMNSGLLMELVSQATFSSGQKILIVDRMRLNWVSGQILLGKPQTASPKSPD